MKEMSVTQIISSDLHLYTGYLLEVHSENQKRVDLKNRHQPAEMSEIGDCDDCVCVMWTVDLPPPFAS